MSSLSTLPKGDSAWLLRKSIQRIMQQVSVLETNIGSSTTGNSANTQVIFNDNGVLRGDAGLTYDKSADRLSFGAGICYGLLTSASATITGDLTVRTTGLTTTASAVGINTASPTANTLTIGANRFLICSDSQSKFGDNGLVNGAAADGNTQIQYFGGKALFFNEGVATRMTLNSTGLGVGTSPSYNIDVLGATLPTISVRSTLAGASNARLYLECAGTNSGHITYNRSLQALTLGATGGTTAQVTLDSVGNVGIGVTPSAWSLGKALNVNSLDGAVLWGYSGVAVFGNNFRFSGGYLYETTAAASRYSQSSGSHEWFTAPSGTAGTAITFTQAMTLDASGNLLVGTTSSVGGRATIVGPSNAYGVVHIQSNTVADTGNPGAIIQKYANDTTTSQILQRYLVNNGATSQGQINANGASQAAFGSYSDSRLKENIISLPSQLANILSLRPVEFDYKDGSGHQIGFVAQEMQEVYSDAVGEQEGFLTVTGWSKTEARLVSAIKELAAKVQALEAKLA